MGFPEEFYFKIQQYSQHQILYERRFSCLAKVLMITHCNNFVFSSFFGILFEEVGLVRIQVL